MQLRLRSVLARHVRAWRRPANVGPTLSPSQLLFSIPSFPAVEPSAALPRIRDSLWQRSGMEITERQTHGIDFELWRAFPRHFPRTPIFRFSTWRGATTRHHGVVHCARNSIKTTSGSTKTTSSACRLSSTVLKNITAPASSGCPAIIRHSLYLSTLRASYGLTRPLSPPTIFSHHVSPQQQRGRCRS